MQFDNSSSLVPIPSHRPPQPRSVSASFAVLDYSFAVLSARALAALSALVPETCLRRLDSISPMSGNAWLQLSRSTCKTARYYLI